MLSAFFSETPMGDVVEMNFFTAHLEGFARWYMMYGDEAKIIKPEELKDRVKKILSELTENLV